MTDVKALREAAEPVAWVVTTCPADRPGRSEVFFSKPREPTHLDRYAVQPLFAHPANDRLTELEAENARVTKERDYAVSEMKEARAYMRVETSHAQQAEAERDTLAAQVKGLVEALGDARAAVSFWGSYASMDIQREHDIARDVARIDAKLAAVKADKERG